MASVVTSKRPLAEDNLKSAKKVKLLDESDSGEDVKEEFTINKDFAKRFEHNKKRTELHKRMFLQCIITATDTLQSKKNMAKIPSQRKNQAPKTRPRTKTASLPMKFWTMKYLLRWQRFAPKTPEYTRKM
jgi:hypothetical protein